MLVRRGFDSPELARRWLASEYLHLPSEFSGIEAAVEKLIAHIRAGSRITIHGDYDVDGVCSTALLLRCLRSLKADVDWVLPTRIDDGYGLSLQTVERLKRRGTGLLITVDCGITAVEEVAAARAAGIDVVVTDHHSVRADGQLPQAPIVHPVVSGYPTVHLCAAAVAYKLAQAVVDAMGSAASEGYSCDDDLDLVALATVADVVPLIEENRTLVKRGLEVLTKTNKPGLKALMRVAKLDPARVDTQAVAFRLAPRLNAAGRLYTPEAALELLLTDDNTRAQQVALELDRMNQERRTVEQRILFEAEAQISELGERYAYVLAGEGWHPGVIGIVASKLVRRHHRPVVMVALNDGRGVGSGRSIDRFDLLAGLECASNQLERYGGHRVAAGLELEAANFDSFRKQFELVAEGRLEPSDLIPVERPDAVVPGGMLGIDLAEELSLLGPFGAGNRQAKLMLPAAVLKDPKPMGSGSHLSFTVESGGVCCRAVAFGVGKRLPVPVGEPVDAIFELEINEWNGIVEPRLLLSGVRLCQPLQIDRKGEPDTFFQGVLAELEADLFMRPELPANRRTVRDCRGHGVAGVIGDLVCASSSVAVLVADVPKRLPALQKRLGGFTLISYAVAERDPLLLAGFDHTVALDPPANDSQLEALFASSDEESFVHLCWGRSEVDFALKVNARELVLREELAALYKQLRAGSPFRDSGSLESVLLGGETGRRSPRLAGRLLRVLTELDLVDFDKTSLTATVPVAGRTDLERSAAYRYYTERYEEGRQYLERLTVEVVAKAA